MIISWKSLALGLAAALLLLLGWTASVLTHADDQQPFAADALAAAGSAFNLSAALRQTPAGPTPLKELFPYAAYLTATDRNDVRRLGQDVQVLDTLYPNNGHDNERLLYTVLTDSLAARWRPGPQTDSLSHLLYLLTWANQLPMAARYDAPRATFFNALHGFWVKRVAQALDGMYRHDAALKYSFRFKHLNQLCQEAKCGVPVGFSAPEKIVNNIVENRWAYLGTKFWRDSPTLTKVGVGSVAGFFLMPWVALAVSVRRRRSAGR